MVGSVGHSGGIGAQQMTSLHGLTRPYPGGPTMLLPGIQTTILFRTTPFLTTKTDSAIVVGVSL